MRGKNTSARLCAKNAGAEGPGLGAYLRDTMVLSLSKYEDEAT